MDESLRLLERAVAAGENPDLLIREYARCGRSDDARRLKIIYHNVKRADKDALTYFRGLVVHRGLSLYLDGLVLDGRNYSFLDLRVSPGELSAVRANRLWDGVMAELERNNASICTDARSPWPGPGRYEHHFITVQKRKFGVTYSTGTSEGLRI